LWQIKRDAQNLRTGWTQVGDRAEVAERLPRLTYTASVINQDVREIKPISRWKERHEVLLDLGRVFALCEAHAAGQAPNVCIHYHALDDPEGVAQHHIGRLACHSR